MSKSKYFSVGKILSSRGIKGELKVQPWTDTLEDFCDIPRIFTNINFEPLNIENLKIYKSFIIMKLFGINTRQKADELKNKKLYAYREDIPIKEDCYFIEDIKNCEVINANDKNMIYGIVKDVINTGANDIYVINSKDNKEYLLPIIKGTIKEINLDENKIYVCAIKGVFDDN